jgi:hypothetical protein
MSPHPDGDLDRRAPYLHTVDEGHCVRRNGLEREPRTLEYRVESHTLSHLKVFALPLHATDGSPRAVEGAFDLLDRQDGEGHLHALPPDPALRDDPAVGPNFDGQGVVELDPKGLAAHGGDRSVRRLGRRNRGSKNSDGNRGKDRKKETARHQHEDPGEGRTRENR